jgi:hypothetical protein
MARTVAWPLYFEFNDIRNNYTGVAHQECVCSSHDECHATRQATRTPDMLGSEGFIIERPTKKRRKSAKGTDGNNEQPLWPEYFTDVSSDDH